VSVDKEVTVSSPATISYFPISNSQLAVPATGSWPLANGTLLLLICVRILSPHMEPHDLERITRLALRELGAGDVPVTIEADRQPDRWRINVAGPQPSTLVVRAGRGTSAQHVREQIYEQWRGR
jgi:hypothetical protein